MEDGDREAGRVSWARDYVRVGLVVVEAAIPSCFLPPPTIPLYSSLHVYPIDTTWFMIGSVIFFFQYHPSFHMPGTRRRERGDGGFFLHFLFFFFGRVVIHVSMAKNRGSTGRRTNAQWMRTEMKSECGQEAGARVRMAMR